MKPEKLTQTYHDWGKWLGNFDWESSREGVNRESQARIVLLGLAGVGKSTLLNRLCGWAVSPPRATPLPEIGLVEPAEDFGLFCLVDLPAETAAETSYAVGPTNGHFNGQGYPKPGSYDPGPEWLPPANWLDPLVMAEGADLLVYVLDGARGVQAADYRWVGRLRRLGIPLLVVLNKLDLIEGEAAARQAETERRLGTAVLAVAAGEANVADGLVAKMISLCPKLTVALGRELSGFRSQAAARLIHRAALLNGLVALEPFPLLDLPVQVMTLTGLMLRIAAVYDRPPTDIRRREVVVALGGGLVGRYGAQQLAKLVPMVGWLVSGIIGWSTTWALGQTAIAYFEAGGDGVVDRGWVWVKNGAARGLGAFRRLGQRRPRVRLPWRMPWKLRWSIPWRKEGRS